MNVLQSFPKACFWIDARDGDPAKRFVRTDVCATFPGHQKPPYR
jgi:hypothetical protein